MIEKVNKDVSRSCLKARFLRKNQQQIQRSSSGENQQESKRTKGRDPEFG